MKNTRMLLAVLCLMGSFAFGEELEDVNYTQQDLDAGRKMLRELTAKALNRQVVLPRPYVFIRSQTKYSGMLYKNHCNKWHDRPLFASRLLWDDGASDHKFASFGKTLDLYQSCGIDGFATFAWPRQGEYERILKVVYDTAQKKGLDPDKFHVMLEVLSGEDYIDIQTNTLKLITDNPYSFRIGGKSVISSYVMDSWPAEQVGKHVEALRRRSGNRILFLPQLHLSLCQDNKGRQANVHALYEVFRKHGTIPASLLRTTLTYLRSYLDICDGLYLGWHVSQVDMTMSQTFSDEVLCPLFGGLLAEEAYNGKKIFALPGFVGYTSYHGTQNRSREGTGTLRKCFDLALKYRPDMVICPEWDELNEDTGFQPLAAKPMSTQRVLKYYMSRFKGEKPQPNPGDDLAIPNLIISQRRQLMPSWDMHVELLNVPDTDESKSYTVTLELLDADDRVVHRTKELSFDAARFQACDLHLPSASYVNCRVLRSRLTINYNEHQQIVSDGLPYTVMRPTVVDDQTYYCTPLRNVLRPTRATVDFRLTGKQPAPGVNEVEVHADLAMPEKINFVEILQNSVEKYAYDPQNEYLQNDAGRRLFKFDMYYINQPSRTSVKLKAGIEGAPGALTFAALPYKKSTPLGQVANVKEKASPAFTDEVGNWRQDAYIGNVDWWSRVRAISVPTGELAQAVLTIEGVRTGGKDKDKPFQWRMPFGDLGEYGVYSKVFEDGLMLSLETVSSPVNHPLPIGSTGAVFNCRLMADNPQGVLGVRVISEEGKIYWSRPFAVTRNISKEQVPVYVYSPALDRGIRISAARNLVPAVRYDFSPDRGGNILFTDAGRDYYGHAGGYLAVANDFWGGEAVCFTIPFYLYKFHVFEGADKPAPDWVRLEDGRWALKFDGERGNFLALPVSFMPQRSGFVLTFDVFPEEVKPEQVLFNHGGYTYGGLQVSVKDGKFRLAFTRATPGNKSLPVWSTVNFDTDIPLHAKQWQEVTVVYDESRLFLVANGLCQSIPLKGVGLYMQISHFGGRGDRTRAGVIPFYKGLLRSIEVQHYVPDELIRKLEKMKKPGSDIPAPEMRGRRWWDSIFFLRKVPVTQTPKKR